MSHTPGEWVAGPPKKQGKHWRVLVRGKLAGSWAFAGAECLWRIALIDNGAPGDTLETEAANARLIAAAPRMLAELKAGIAVLADLAPRSDAHARATVAGMMAAVRLAEPVHPPTVKP